MLVPFQSTHLFTSTLMKARSNNHACAGSLLRLVQTIGSQFKDWGVQLQRPAALSAAGPEFGCDLSFPSEGKSGASAGAAQVFIQEQIPNVVSCSSELLLAVQLANVV